MKPRTLVCILLALTMMSCGPANRSRETFSFKTNDQGVELLENGNPVFFYQKVPKSLTGQYICNNYLHPLYSLSGDTLSEEFPADHTFHRGIFWAWHQISVNDDSIGDGWVNQHISYEVTGVQTESDKSSAQFKLKVLWKSDIFQGGNPFMEENTIIVAHKSERDIRKIDFQISLKALVEGLMIGGSDDEKGYGGFCTRIKLPDGLVFTSERGPVQPQNLQLEAGPWMDFSGNLSAGAQSGLTILCHPSNPVYPSTWILRQKKSMQNAVYPGREKIRVSTTNPTVLRYRLIIHNGDAASVNIPELQKEYEKLYSN